MSVYRGEDWDNLSSKYSNGASGEDKPEKYHYDRQRYGGKPKVRVSHKFDDSQLRKAVTELTKALSPEGALVSALRDVAMNTTVAANDLKMVAREPNVRHILQSTSAYEDVGAAATTAYEYIDKVDDLLWLCCCNRMTSLVNKRSTMESIHSDLETFKSIIHKMEQSLSEAEETYCALKPQCERAVRSCDEAEAVCKRKAMQHYKMKTTAQVAGGTLAAAGVGAAVIGGGIAAVAIGFLTFGIGAPVVAGITAAVAGGIGATAGTGGVATAIATAAIAKEFDVAAKAFSDASRKCASVKNSALRLSRAAADVRGDLERISKELDWAQKETLYTTVETVTETMTVVQTELLVLLLNNGSASHQRIAESCAYVTQITKKGTIHQYSCHETKVNHYTNPVRFATLDKRYYT